MHDIVGQAWTSACARTVFLSWIIHSFVHSWLSSECEPQVTQNTTQKLWVRQAHHTDWSGSQASWSSLVGMLHMVCLHAAHLSSTPCILQDSWTIIDSIDKWNHSCPPHCCVIAPSLYYWRVVSILIVTVHGSCLLVYGKTIFHLSHSIRFNTMYGVTDYHTYIWTDSKDIFTTMWGLLRFTPVMWPLHVQGECLS